MGPNLVYGSVSLADAATTDKNYYLVPPLTGKYKLVGGTFTPDGDGAATTDGTEARTITLKKGSTSLAVITTDTDGSEVAFVAGTPIAFSITGSGTDIEFTGQTDPVIIASVHAGATGRVAKGVVQLVWEKLHQGV
jgi:hypothetical protein